MPSDKITIALDGDIPLQSFATALGHLNSIVTGLTAEVAGQPVDWLIDELSYSSAIATIRGYAENDQAVRKTVEASEYVFRAIETGGGVPYGPRVSGPAYELTRLVGGRVIAIHLSTNDDFHATIQTPRLTQQTQALYRQAYGRVEGVVENLFRRSARFMMVDSIHHRPVSCRLDADQLEMMRGVWGKRAAVTGWVTREARTGRPIMIERISSVMPVLSSERGQFRAARGAVKRPANSPSPEELIRKIRDGS